jgi:hypothetical protein
MIVCPNCLHQNPDGAAQCEACYTGLPEMSSCPSCGASVQTDASFCGQCGFNLKQQPATPVSPEPAIAVNGNSNHFEIPELIPPDPLVIPELYAEPGMAESGVAESSVAESGVAESGQALILPLGQPMEGDPPTGTPAVPTTPPPPPPAMTPPPPAPAIPIPVAHSPENFGGGNPKTQFQQIVARLLHLQTDTLLELPLSLTVIHLGKPNDRIPPDIDVAGFPNSEVVSRIHADIRVEGDTYFIEDVGSANGTYINNLPLPPGNRHRLRAGDRIALGKGDLVTFLFQLS